jgi:hypothetical protein
MNKAEQPPVIKPKAYEGKIISPDIADIFREAQRDKGSPIAKKPSLDYYDNRRDTKEDGSDVPYEGRYGKFEE